MVIQLVKGNGNYLESKLSIIDSINNFLNPADDHTHTDSGPCMSSGGLVQLAMLNSPCLDTEWSSKTEGGVTFLDEYIAWIQPPF